LTAVASELNIDPETDLIVLRILVDMHHQVMDFMTPEWIRFVPEIVGNLCSIAARLPPMSALSRRFDFEAPEDDPSIPSELLELLDARNEFMAAQHAYLRAASALRTAVWLVINTHSRVRNYPEPDSPQAISRTELDSLARVFHSMFTACDGAIHFVFMCHARRDKAFNHMVFLFTGGAFLTVGSYGIEETVLLYQLWQTTTAAQLNQGFAP
jgi:hypothetical protein